WCSKQALARALIPLVLLVAGGGPSAGYSTSSSRKTAPRRAGRSGACPRARSMMQRFGTSSDGGGGRSGESGAVLVRGKHLARPRQGGRRYLNQLAPSGRKNATSGPATSGTPSSVNDP
ncbi:unnamed protein product, partial [Ectocarpus sp. 12 AP-2014]